MAVTKQQALKVLEERGIPITPQEQPQQDAGTIVGQRLERHLPAFAVRGIAQAAPTLQAIAQSAPVQGVLGAGDVMRGNIGALLPSSIRPQFVPTGDPSRLAYKVGGGIGDIASYLLASELGGAALTNVRALPLMERAAQALEASRAPEALKEVVEIERRALPLLGRTMESLGGGAGRILGTGAYGAATTPDSRVRGGLIGLAGGTLGEALPALAGLAKYASPQRLTDSIMNYIRGGRSVEENAQSLAADIKKSFETKQGEASDLYSPLFDSVGDSSIYGNIVKPTSKLGIQIDPAISSLIRRPYLREVDGNIVNLPQVYQALKKDITKSYLPDTRELHNEFIDNPTVQNAHNLQSQLGFDLRELQKKPIKDTADNINFQNWRKARNNLQQDVHSFLNVKDNTGDLSKMYGDATNYYRENIAHYLTNKDIAKIAKGKITNPSNVANIFKFPEEEVTKVVNDLGDEGKKKIIYSGLTKKVGLTPQDLVNQMNGLEKKGLESYITPNLQMQLDKLPARMGAKTALQRGVGLALGLATIPRAAGVGAEIGGGIGAAALTPAIMRSLQRNLPIAPIARGISKAYPAIRKGALGLSLGQSLPSGITSNQRITPEQAREILKERGIQ